MCIRDRSDTTKYKALEVGHWMAEDIEPHLYQAIANYENMIDENEFCVVMVLATDPLIKNLIRRKFYCWPYLPSPRPVSYTHLCLISARDSERFQKKQPNTPPANIIN